MRSNQACTGGERSLILKLGGEGGAHAIKSLGDHCAEP